MTIHTVFEYNRRYLLIESRSVVRRSNRKENKRKQSGNADNPHKPADPSRHSHKEQPPNMQREETRGTGAVSNSTSTKLESAFLLTINELL
jgi:hypothetical protein